MKLIKYPSKEQWTELLKRPALNTESLFDTVRSIINKVRTEGDKAVLEYEAAFDKVTLSALAVTPEEVQAAGTLVNDELKAAISLAKQNIETFHSSQRFVGKKVETIEKWLKISVWSYLMIRPMNRVDSCIGLQPRKMENLSSKNWRVTSSVRTRF